MLFKEKRIIFSGSSDEVHRPSDSLLCYYSSVDYFSSSPVNFTNCFTEYGVHEIRRECDGEITLTFVVKCDYGLELKASVLRTFVVPGLRQWRDALKQQISRSD